MLVLDDTILAGLRIPDASGALLGWVRGQLPEQLYVSVISLAALLRAQPAAETWIGETEKNFQDRILGFGMAEARLYAALSQTLEEEGEALQLAATVLLRDGVLVTDAPARYRASGVRLLNPLTG